jgi:hypothetical protein
MCFHVDEEAGVGLCVGLCGGTPEAPSCAEPGTDCAISEDGILNLCLKTCDPLAQGCPDDQRCLDVGQGFFCVGAAEAPGGYGDPCEGSAACDAGLACIDDAAVPGCAGLRCCSPYCAVSAPNTCPGMPEQSCVPWYEPGQAPADSEDLGVCAAL